MHFRNIIHSLCTFAFFWGEFPSFSWGRCFLLTKLTTKDKGMKLSNATKTVGICNNVRDCFEIMLIKNEEKVYIEVLPGQLSWLECCHDTQRLWV